MNNNVLLSDVEKILKKLETALMSVEPAGGSEKGAEVMDMAARYVSDAKHYIERGDLRTAFGAVEYAHGLLDGAVGSGTLKVTKPENSDLFVF